MKRKLLMMALLVSLHHNAPAMDSDDEFSEDADCPGLKLLLSSFASTERSDMALKLQFGVLFTQAFCRKMDERGGEPVHERLTAPLLERLIDEVSHTVGREVGCVVSQTLRAETFDVHRNVAIALEVLSRSDGREYHDETPDSILTALGSMVAPMEIRQILIEPAACRADMADFFLEQKEVRERLARGIESWLAGVPAWPDGAESVEVAPD